MVLDSALRREITRMASTSRPLLIHTGAGFEVHIGGERFGRASALSFRVWGQTWPSPSTGDATWGTWGLRLRALRRYQLAEAARLLIASTSTCLNRSRDLCEGEEICSKGIVLDLRGQNRLRVDS